MTDQGLVHYETFGRGKPVVLLHGWLGSWGIWQETMAHLGSGFRTYALDFWGFGESGRKRVSYQIESFVDLVEEFMDRLGIAQAPLVGHSMGGTVALSVALKYPQRAVAVAVIGSPIDGRSLAIPLKLAGHRPIATLVHTFPSALRLGLRFSRPIITRDPRWYDMVKHDLSNTTLESFLNSIASLRKTDLRSTLADIRVPVLGIYGKKDVIVHPRQWELFHKPHTIARFDQSGHFPMLDQPDSFRETLAAFLKEQYD
jgi:pimeloyl-ACP methyl ester carboxylesterase